MLSAARSKLIATHESFAWTLCQHSSGYWYYTVMSTTSGRTASPEGSWPRALCAYRALVRNFNRIRHVQAIQKAGWT